MTVEKLSMQGGYASTEGKRYDTIDRQSTQYKAGILKSSAMAERSAHKFYIV